MTDPGSDPTVQRLRDEISGVDRSILDAVNARLELVALSSSTRRSWASPSSIPTASESSSTGSSLRIQARCPTTGCGSCSTRCSR